jgi:hypothetical protein
MKKLKLFKVNRKIMRFFKCSSPGISNLKFGGRLLFFESMLEINYSSVSMG